MLRFVLGGLRYDRGREGDGGEHGKGDGEVRVVLVSWLREGGFWRREGGRVVC